MVRYIFIFLAALLLSTSVHYSATAQAREVLKKSDTAAKSPTATQDSAMAFSIRLESIVDTTEMFGKVCGMQFRKIKETTKDYASLRPLVNDMIKFADRNLKQVKAMKNVAGSEKLKKEMVAYLTLEKSFYTNAFMPLTRLKKTATDAQVKKASDKIVKDSARESEALKKLKAAGKEYVLKNNLKSMSASPKIIHTK